MSRVPFLPSSVSSFAHAFTENTLHQSGGLRPAMPACRELRQGDILEYKATVGYAGFQAGFGYRVRSCLYKTKEGGIVRGRRTGEKGDK